ncbi:hypothetical protein RFI_12254, partial [Reticulomyxa filosa]
MENSIIQPHNLSTIHVTSFEEKKDDDEQEQPSPLHKHYHNTIYMCVYSRANKAPFAVAFIDKESEALYFGEYMSKSLLFLIYYFLKSLEIDFFYWVYFKKKCQVKLRINPCIILCNTKPYVRFFRITLKFSFFLSYIFQTNQNFFFVLQKRKNHPINQQLAHNAMNEFESFTVQSLSINEFAIEYAKSVISNVTVMEISHHQWSLHTQAKEDKLLPFRSIIPFSNHLILGCIGALLSYAIKNRVLDQMHTQIDDQKKATNESLLELQYIRPIPTLRKSCLSFFCFFKIYYLEDMCVVDNETMKCLCIFVSERNPSFKGVRTIKEGLSIFSLFNKTHTSHGRNVLKHWLLFPLTNIVTIQNRLDTIEWLLRHETLLRDLKGCLSNIRDLNRILTKVITYQSTFTDWLVLNSSLQALHQLLTVIRSDQISNANNMLNLDLNRDTKPSILNDILIYWSEDISIFHSHLNKTIDFDQSKAQRKVVIQSGVSDELDRLRRTYNGLETLLSDILRQEMSNGHIPLTNTNNNGDISIVYFQHLGYLLEVNDDSLFNDFLKRQNCFHKFAFNHNKYYKTDKMKELDRKLGDLKALINDTENSTLRNLIEQHLLKIEMPLKRLNELIAKLDAFCSLTTAAAEYQLTKPLISDENVLQIKNGTHLLQQMCLTSEHTFIPNDIAMNEQSDDDTVKSGRIAIVTGPNQSGKSVFLKQVGIIVYLAHIGAFVPAEYVK